MPGERAHKTLECPNDRCVRTITQPIRLQSFLGLYLHYTKKWLSILQTAAKNARLHMVTHSSILLRKVSLKNSSIIQQLVS